MPPLPATPVSGKSPGPGLPVMRSATARRFFLASAIITVGLLLAIHVFGLQAGTQGLTPIFHHLFLFSDYYGAMALLIVLVCAIFVPEGARAGGLLRWLGRHPGRFAAAWLLLLCAGSLLVYRNHPLSMDEYAQVLQSRIFAAGHLTGRWPVELLDWLVPEGFQYHFLRVSDETGQVFSSYWPAFALILTPFVWLGIPWACNPVISAVTLLGVHRLTLALFNDREAAALAMLLTAASPVFFANGISFYSMPAHLLANLLFALLLLRPTPGRAAAAGLIGSVALTLHNPVPHMAFALPWIVWILTREGGVRLAACLFAGYAPLCLLLGVGWFWFSGEMSAPAAGPDDGSTLPFAWPTATVVLARFVGAAKIWLWAVPGLALLALAGLWRWRMNHACVLMALAALGTLAIYYFVPFDQGHGWGYRYFHSAWFVLPVLAAAALVRPAAPDEERNARHHALRTYVVACAMLTMAIGVPHRALQMNEFISSHLAQMPGTPDRGRGVVLIDPGFAFYGYDLVQNDPFLRGDIIRMISHGTEANENMMREYFPHYRRTHANEFGETWTYVPPSP